MTTQCTLEHKCKQNAQETEYQGNGSENGNGLKLNTSFWKKKKGVNKTFDYPNIGSSDYTVSLEKLASTVKPCIFVCHTRDCLKKTMG